MKHWWCRLTFRAQGHIVVIPGPEPLWKRGRWLCDRCGYVAR